MTELKLPYGLRAGELVYIAEVERGLGCDCFCPACNYPLVARKGRLVTHHFAHYKGSTCEYGVETALHMAAKKLLEAERAIHLPSFEVTFNSYKKSWWVPDRWVSFDKVQLEKRVSDIVPDILVYVGERPLMIEIVVTHRIDDDKAAKVKQLGISTIEIDISHLSREFTDDLLTDFVIRRVETKRWIHNAKEQQIRDQLKRMSDIRTLIHRNGADYVEGCPKRSQVRRGRSYTSVMNECIYCDYCMDIDGLICAGKQKIVSYNDLKAIPLKNRPLA